MKKIRISDVTLRENTFSFKEKIEIAKLLEKIGVDVIEVPKIVNKRIDVLFLHTIIPVVKKSIISCPVELTTESIDTVCEAMKDADEFMIHISVPVSTVQMEYVCHKKPKAVIEMIKELVGYASERCKHVEFSAVDATRSEFDFLTEAVEAAVSAGAESVTICDTAGILLPSELEKFIVNVKNSVSGLENKILMCECSDELNLSVSSSVSAVNAGADGIKTVMTGICASSLKAIAHIISTKGDSMGVSSTLRYTALNHSVDKMMKMAGGALVSAEDTETYADIVLGAGDDISKVSIAVAKLGYELSEDDIAKVYEEFKNVSEKKQIGAKELDAIVASAALQVPPTYKVKSYVVNNGNVISATANIVLIKNGEEIPGVSIGDGPIDAAFRAVEQIIGYHYELDDFQIQSVTQGQEAVGSAVVRLRADGKLYSGRGVSTDVIGASIFAYINALNKICFEQ